MAITIYRRAQIFVAFLICITPSQAQNATTTACDCYRVKSGGTNQQFGNHRFWDFRSLQGQGQGYFNSTTWTDDWGVMSWGKAAASDAPLALQNSADNVFISQADSSDDVGASTSQSTYLSLKTTRVNSTLQSTAEVESELKNVLHGSIRAYARINPLSQSKGACAGFFTYADEKNEVDIEILTRDNSSTWRLTNQPALDSQGNEIPEASQAPQNVAYWSSWHEIRIDWVQDTTIWYVDGRSIGANTYSVPKVASGLVLNMWSDGGVWSGEMAVNGSAQFDFQWIEMVYNTTNTSASKRDTSSTKSCKTMCTIDSVVRQGVPQAVASGASVFSSDVRMGLSILTLSLMFALVVL